MAPPRRRRFPPLTSRQAGGWGLPGPGTGRPASLPVQSFDQLMMQQIRYGEGTKSGIIPLSGSLTLLNGPEGLATWYVSYVAISTTTGALDNSTAAVTIGPAVAQGIVPAGQGYAGGGDSISLGGAQLAPGEYVIVTWTGANPGDLALMTVFGNQQVLTP